MSRTSDLLREANQVLAELELLSEARTSQGFDARVSSGKPGARMLRQDAPTSLEGQHATLEAWIRGAQRALDNERRRPADANPGETANQFRARILTEHKGKDYKLVANIEHVSKAYVWKLRVAAGAEPHKGMPARTQVTRRTRGF